MDDKKKVKPIEDEKLEEVAGGYGHHAEADVTPPSRGYGEDKKGK